jgi:hypothetical protein
MIVTAKDQICFGFSLAVSNHLFLFFFQEPRLNPIAPTFTPRESPSTPYKMSTVSQVPLVSDFTKADITAFSPQTTNNGKITRPGPSQDTYPQLDAKAASNAMSKPVTTPPGASDRAGFRCMQRITDVTKTDDSLKQDELQSSNGPDQQSSGRFSRDSMRGSMRGRGRYSKVKWNRPHYPYRAQSKSEPTAPKDGED